MKTVESTRPVELRHSQLLDQLKVHGYARIRFEAAGFVDIFRPPAGAPFFSHACWRRLQIDPGCRYRLTQLIGRENRSAQPFHLLELGAAEVGSLGPTDRRPQHIWVLDVAVRDGALAPRFNLLENRA